MSKKTFLPDLPGVLSLVLFATLVCFGGGKALYCADTLWHIRVGQEMLRQGRILDADIFSHTAFGKPWITHEWLSEVIMAVLHHLAGLPGVVVFYFLLVAATFWVLFKIAALKSDNEWVAISCILVSFLLSYTHLLARPHIFTWLFGTITLYILLRGTRRGFHFLPLLTVLWANLHGGFVLGFLLQAFFISGAILDGWPRPFSAKALAHSIKSQGFFLVILLLSILAATINPFWYRLYLIQLHVNQEAFMTAIGEWQAPDLQEMWFFRIYIILVMALVLFKKGKLSATYAGLLLFFVNMSLAHARHVSVAGLMLTPVVASLVNSHLPGRRPQKDQLILSPVTGPAATAGLFLAALLFLGINPTGKALAASMFPLPEEYSRNALKFIEEHRPAGRMLNQYSLGGFLLYSLPSPQNVFIDGRADMYGAQIFSDYGKMAKMEDGAEELLAKYDIGWIIFPNDAAIIKQLRLSGSWRTAFTDEHLTILVANDKRLAEQ